MGKKINSSAFEYLKSIQQSHTKVKHIPYKKLNIAPYLTDSRFHIDEKILLFKLRTSMSDVKGNFKNGLVDISCGLCQENEPQTQEHLLSCTELINNCQDLYNDREVEYSDLVQGVNKQLKCVRLYSNDI